VRNGGYGTGTGTSFAAPNVASTLALLSEAYQRNNPGTPPPGALLKAIACNTADDAGRSGPDFEYGFGILNAYNALQVINANQFELGTITTSEVDQKTIRVEEGTSELKVMLYWNDVAGSTTNQRPVLENDLALVLISENGETSYPLVLDPSNPLQVAVPGQDHLNNVEQISIKNPAQGDYRVEVSATNLSYGSSGYVLTWYAPKAEVVLTCPYGGESIIPGQSTYLAWTATTGNQGDWIIEYSEDGQTWKIAADEIPGEDRSVRWTAPSSMSKADFRITNTAVGVSDETNAAVSVVRPPLNLTSTEVCASTLQFSWSPSDEAVRYEVYRFDGEEMKEIGSTTDTLWRVEELSAGESLLLSVSSVTEANQASKRAYGYEVTHTGLEPACRLPSIIEWGALLTEELGPAARVLWEVNKEQRIQRFEVERGLLHQNNIEWTYVDSVRAKGTSSSALLYQLDDVGAAQQGLTYYRIRMVDEDGLGFYSDEFIHERATTSGIHDPIGANVSFTLLQNPVGQTIQINSTKPTPQTVDLYDAIGRKRASFELQAGSNQFPWPINLGTGLYVLRGTEQTSTQAIKLVHN